MGERGAAKGDTASAERAGGPPLRRVPVQDRGQRRVERILDAAAEVIAESGVDAATTNAIAARARTSVGSLYQFFPNKEAIVQALAARYGEELGALGDDTFGGVDARLPLPALIDATAMRMAAFHQAHPAYGHVYAAAGRPGAQAQLKESIVDHVAGLIHARNPALPGEDVRIYARVNSEQVHAVAGEAARAAPEDRPPLLRELRAVLLRYVEPMEPGAGAASTAG